MKMVPAGPGAGPTSFPHSRMPQHKSAEKRVRQNAKRRARNRYHKVRVRTLVKRLEGTEDRTEAEALLSEVKGTLDRMATKRIITRSKAAHTKSHLEKLVNAL